MKFYILPILIVTALAGLVRAQTDPKTVLATVNGRTITQAEVDAALKTRPLPLQLPKEETQQKRFEVVCMMIDALLWEDYLHKAGPDVKAEVDKFMAEIAEEATKDKKSLESYCKEQGQTVERVREMVTMEFQWAALARAKISDADIKRYYDDNKDFFDGVRVHASHILMRVARNAPEAEKQAAREKLLAIRAHLVAGTLDFAEAARRYSQDATTAAQGGDLGTFPRKMYYDENLSRAAFALPVGGLSDVVESEYGLQLIKVSERKAAEQPSEYEKIKDVVRDFCIDDLRNATLQQLRKSADIKITIPK